MPAALRQHSQRYALVTVMAVVVAAMVAVVAAVATIMLVISMAVART